MTRIVLRSDGLLVGQSVLSFPSYAPIETFFRKELNPGPKILNTEEDFKLFTDNDDNQVEV